MFDSSMFSANMISNPSAMATTIIDAMESSDTKNSVSINDPNNGFVMMLFSNLSVFSKFSEKVDHINSFFYPQRARNVSQLYAHLSEFDYVKLMASPATLPFIFELSKDWIIANAVYYDANYNKLEIPATGYISMGGVVYSHYYPIEILVNRNTGAVDAFYNTSINNSLHALETNMLLEVHEFIRDGINWFHMQFNMHQFERSISTCPVGSEQGFNKTLSYTDQFYAAKVFYQNNMGEWVELLYSLDKMFYDFTTPTALLTLLSDTSELKVTIPQIYFDNRQLSQTIKIELYTTKGKVEYSLSYSDVKEITANFDTNSSNYAAPLMQMPSWLITPTTTKVSGGSNGMSYEEIRDSIVNQRLYTRVAVTGPELVQAGAKAGFNLYNVIDDLTERMYYASNILKDDRGMIIPTFSGNILLANDNLLGNPSTIINYSDGYYTILPTTLFKIPEVGTTCIPMTDGEVAALSELTKSDLINELNKGIYVRQPFHITMITTKKSPQASIYNLMSCSMTSLAFIAENPHSAPQMAVSTCSVVHQYSGTGGYLINLGLVRSSNITATQSSNFKVLLTCKDKQGNYVYIPATYVSTTNGIDVWQIGLSTTYHITIDNHISVMMYNESNNLVSVEISLNQTFNVLTSFVSSYDPSIPVDTSLNSLLPSFMQSTDVVMAHQSMTLTLGYNLSANIYTGINTTWGSDVYQVAEETIYYNTNVPIFQKNELGVIETRVNSLNNTVEVVILHQNGSIPSSLSDIDLTTTSSISVPSSGSTTLLHVTDTTGILPGMIIRGLHIPVNTHVISTTADTAQLSNLITDVIPTGTVCTVTNPHLHTRTTISQTAIGPTLTVTDTSSIIVGQSVFGFGISTDTKILSVDSPTTFTLDKPSTEIVLENTLISILNTTNRGVVKVEKGSVISDSLGNPLILESGKNQYRIPAILFDGRIFESNDPSDISVILDLYQNLQNYANQVATIDAGLLEGAEVFYKPSRTMGFATFGVGDNKTLTLPLELNFSVNVYVSVDVYNNAKLLSSMEDTIHSIINTEIQKPLISVTSISDAIVSVLSSNIEDIEMGGINGNSELRLIALEESDTKPSIENKLILNSDSSVSRVPNIKVKFIIGPSTVV